jgi:hypothetical protein
MFAPAEQAKAADVSAFLGTIPELLWFAFAVVAVVALRRPLLHLTDILLWRLRLGASLKIASFEIGATVQPDQTVPTGASRSYSARPDAGRVRFQQRESYYLPNRNLQLVHRAVPSRNRKYAYDVLIYLVPHPNVDATLACVARVDYYCGRGWSNAIFEVTDRSRGFPLALSTYGPFVCTAEIQFTDGNSIIIGRYIDQEMPGTSVEQALSAGTAA